MNFEPIGSVIREARLWVCVVVLGVAMGTVSGCKTGPDLGAPNVAVPKAFRTTLPVAGVEAAAAGTLAAWWKVFEDPVLDRLMAEAAAANLDVRVAQARVREARALRGVARSALFPTLDATGSYTRNRSSENTMQGRQMAIFGEDLEQDLFSAGVDMNWEIDVFGGRRRAVEVATAEVDVSEEQRRDVWVGVLAEVGASYLELRGAERQLSVARGNLAAQEQTAALTRDRFAAGLTSELDTAQAAAQVATTRAQIPPLEEARQRALHRLGVLTGRAPGAWAAELESPTGLPKATPGVPVGLPSDLLRQRPDIRRAEREVAAAGARVGVATAELFPKFYLTGAAGLQSVAAEDFALGGSRFWSLGPSLRWPVFQAGRIRRQIRAENARHEQALLRYEQVVLVALEEVENALVAFGQEQDRQRALAEAELAVRRTVVLANERYRSGLVDFLDVLEAERSLLSAQDSLVRSERQLGQNLVRLYRALGGGWHEGPVESATEAPDLATATRPVAMAKVGEDTGWKSRQDKQDDEDGLE